MADWKMPVSYNYNPSYHAYAYGLMYNSHGPEQTHPTRSWAEAAYSTSAGVTGGFFSSQASSQSPPGSPECATPNTNGHYPTYYTDSQSHTQNGRLFLSNNRVHYDAHAKDQDQAGTGSDTPSDSEVHTPDSWSSGSSREVGIPPTEPDALHWIKKEGAYALNSGCPDGSEVVRNSLAVAVEEPKDLPAGVSAVLSPPEQLPAKPRKAKARTAFSEGQMNALNDRFNMQRYLTPAEMKTLAGLTGLTYKQVKTWFQNRRMKLKRHQKDNSWASERYITAGIPNAPTPPQFQVDAPILSQDLFSNPQFRDSVFKKSPPQTPSFYPNYTQPLSPPQMSARPQGNWPLPPAVTHYEFPNPSSYVSLGGNSDDGSAVDLGNNPTQLVTVHNASQWST